MTGNKYNIQNNQRHIQYLTWSGDLPVGIRKSL